MSTATAKSTETDLEKLHDLNRDYIAAASGRYTDVWVRRAGRWNAVSAHVTRG